MRQIFDIVGVGFGPSNLALAAAISEKKEHDLLAVFLEKEAQFTWHKEMLLDNTEMQISFLKDLVTLRNPSSPYTFLNYLHEQGRLSSFINLKNFHPTRIEFNDYFLWVANKLNRYVQYNNRVVDIIPYGAEPYRLLEVITHDLYTGKTRSIIAKNVVVATGGEAVIPDFVFSKHNSHRIWHTSKYLEKISTFKKELMVPYHFSVVGGGQSAAEIAYDLYTNFPNSIISCIQRNFGYKPADESPFSNEIFNPETVDLFYFSESELRNKFIETYRDTNYSVVDVELIKKLYSIKYEESVRKTRRLRYMCFTSIMRMSETDKGVQIDAKDLLSKHPTTLNVDAVVLATGYEFKNYLTLLNSLKDHFIFNDIGKPEITRHYQVSTTHQLLAGIFIQGGNESTHGLTDTLLSIGAIRAHEILHQIELLKDRDLEEASNSIYEPPISLGEHAHV